MYIYIYIYIWDFPATDHWDPQFHCGEAISSGSSSVGAVSGAGSLPMVCWGPELDLGQKSRGR